MRIITGKLKGRKFDAPPGHRTHPMGDKVRGALFSMLGDISGLTVFDPYAGTGALSFEALSRGAKHATLVEIEKTAQQIILENIKALGLENQTTFIPGNCTRWSLRYPDEKFDLLLCDPPYDRVLIGTIEKLGKHVILNGLLVLSWPRHVEVTDLRGFEQIKSTVYANARLIFYRRFS